MDSQTEAQDTRRENLEEHIAAGVARNGLMLRTILERLDQIVDLLMPKSGEGPTLDELLARLVSLVMDQAVLLQRIDDQMTVLLADSRASGKVGEA